MAASIQSFFHFRKNWSLFSHVGCVPTQEEMPRQDRIQKEKEKAKKVNYYFIIPQASTASAPGSPHHLIEDENYLYLLKHFLSYSYWINQYKPYKSSYREKYTTYIFEKREP